MVCPLKQGGGGEVSQCGHFANKGKGVNFSRFCTRLVDGPFE